VSIRIHFDDDTSNFDLYSRLPQDWNAFLASLWTVGPNLLSINGGVAIAAKKGIPQQKGGLIIRKNDVMTGGERWSLWTTENNNVESPLRSDIVASHCSSTRNILWSQLRMPVFERRRRSVSVSRFNLFAS
jgi:hypothetical protein